MPAALSKCLRLMEEFRQLEPDLPAQVIHAFLVIAAHPGCTYAELKDRAGMSKTSVGRAVQYLGTTHRLGKKGLALVHVKSSPTDARTKHCYLTAKGERLVERISYFIEGAKS